jgi:rhodanese-related sulfurtransferase
MKMLELACTAGAALAFVASASAQVVAEGACPRYAIDIAALASCDEDDVARAKNRQIPANKVSHSARQMTAAEAYALLRQTGPGAALVDVRTRLEVAFVGGPAVDHLLVPYRHPVPAGAGDWKLEPNHSFGEQLVTQLAARGIGPEQLVVLICRSGELSALAADELSDFGYTQIVTVVDGFEGDLGRDGRRNVNGWKNAGLPWRADSAVSGLSGR